MPPRTAARVAARATFSMSWLPDRVFLGWDRPFLEAAAGWLLERFDGDLDGVVVALPGRRAARRLQDRLAMLAATGFRPPEVLTAGALSDRLLLLPARRTERLARTLAWAEALRRAPAQELAPLIPHPPDQADFEAWWALAGRLRRLHGELAAEGMSFAAVADALPPACGAAELMRWRALVPVQEGFRAVLESAGLADPHESRLEAARAGRTRPARAVVLAGIFDAPALLRRALRAAAAPTTALVFAPQAQEGWFDDLGLARREPWQEAGARLPLERCQWLAVGHPGDQADAVARAIDSWNGAYGPQAITVGLGQEELAPLLARRLDQLGVHSRPAAGTPLAATRAARLLQAAADFLDGQRFPALAALLRHPDVEDALRRRGAVDGPPDAAVLDAYAAVHLPDRAARLLPGAAQRAGPAGARVRAVFDLLGPLAEAEPRPLPRWAEPVAALLEAVYDLRPLRPEHQDDRLLHGALELLGDGLRAVAALPESLCTAAPVDAATALRLLLRESAAAAVAPPADEGAVEMLGWLELALDDAPALVVAGFQDGSIPESVHGDPFLPDALRGALGLPDNALRLARDAVSLATLLHSKERLVLVSGRRSGENEPLMPSRLAFLVPEEELPARVGYAFRELEAESPRAEAAAPPPPPRPRRLPLPELESIRVTDFRAYLASPYGYYLERLLRLRPVDDRASELDPMAFGTLAHQVLEAFGRGPARDSASEDQVRGALEAELRSCAAARFGERPLAAVRLQLEQLRFRLGRFAAWQARQAGAGWRIHDVEATPKVAPLLEVDDRPLPLIGQVDRVDVHPQLGWRLLDYKTGDKVKKPELSHRRGDRWIDLQLPLYALLAPGLGVDGSLADGRLALGYLALPASAEPETLLLASWEPEQLEDAYSAARQVVRAIRAGQLFELGDDPPRDPQIAAIAGLGLLGAEADEEDEA